MKLSKHPTFYWPSEPAISLKTNDGSADSRRSSRRLSRQEPEDAADIEAGTWRKSTRSGGGANGANCVEAASCACHGIAVRDSKHLATPPLAISRADWTALLSTIRAA